MSQASLATALVAPFEHLRMTDVDTVGGKNASLGEMISQLAATGVRVPGGFATTAHAFRQFLQQGALAARIQDKLATLDTDDVRALADAGTQIRQWIIDTPLPPDLEAAIRGEFERLSAGNPDASFAVRSSATAEDMPDASFAGQQETFLNVSGIDDVLHRMKEVFASLYNDRAISYRVHKGYAHADVALSAGVQRMVRSDLGAAGVMFTIDTESGFAEVVFITSSYGLGEMVVQGAVNPDEFYVHKHTLRGGRPAVIRRVLGSKLQRMEFAGAADQGADPASPRKLVRTVDTPPEQRNRYSLTDDDVQELARYALTIEQHYGRAMDIEWGKDGIDGRLYILQARPETVKSQAGGRVEQRWRIKGDRAKNTVLAEGRAIGQKVGTGPVRLVAQPGRDGPRATGRRAGHRHDRPQLGAGDEACRRHRHQPRRPHLPRRHHRARTRHSGRGGLRRRHRAAGRRRAGDRVVRRGRHRLHLRRSAGDRGQRGRERRDAVLPDQDHDERRQPAAGVRLRADAQQRRRAGAAGIHHQQQHRRPPEGDPGLPQHRRRPEEGGGIGGARPCVAARLLRRQAGRRHSPPLPLPSGPSR